MRSLSRAISIIRAFSPKQLELSGNEIVAKIAVPKSTVYRILDRLTTSGLLEHNPQTGKYSIGSELYVKGSLYLSSTDILKAAEPVMKSLNDLTNEAVNLGILDNGNLVFTMKEESKFDFRWSKHIGTSLPAYCSSMGKALLSELTGAEIDELYPEEKLLTVTPKTIATKTELKRELEQIKKAGIALDREGGSEGVEGIAAVLRDISGEAVASMSIAVPTFRLDQDLRTRLSRLVLLGTNLISYQLGYRDTAEPVRNIAEISSWWEQSQTE